MAQGWSQRPNFVPIRLNELFNGLQVEHTDDYVLAMVGGLGGRHEQEVRLFMLRHDHAARSGVLAGLRGGRRRRDLAGQHRQVLARGIQLAQHGRAAGQRRHAGAGRARLPGGAQPGFLRLSRRLVLARMSLAPTPEETAADQPLLRLCLVRRSPPLSRWASSSWRSCTSTACSTPRPSCKLAAALFGAEGGGAVGAAHAGGAGRAGRGRVRRGGAGAGFGPGASACRRAAGGGEGAGQAGP